MGAVAGDFDGDGDPDLLVTHFGEERLFWNRGDGTFREAPGAAGATDPRWTTSAALFDPDRDGDLDVYAANYLDYAIERHRDCVSPVRELLAYCHPQEYPGAADSFFENLGDGTFRASRVPGSDDGKGLGVVISDLEGDGAPDVHVANDTTPNFLFRTVAGPDGVRFVEEGLASGVAYNEEGLPEAGMGNDFGDVDRDGLMDLVVTNFDFETNTLYRNLGGGLFLDATASFGLGSESLTELAFGCDLADFDNDGWLDLVVANGHILDNIARIQSNLTFAQPGQVFGNDRGRLRRRRRSEGDFARPRVGRGLATSRLRPRRRPRPRARQQSRAGGTPREPGRSGGRQHGGAPADRRLGATGKASGPGSGSPGAGSSSRRSGGRGRATSPSTIRCCGSVSARRRVRRKSAFAGLRGRRRPPGLCRPARSTSSRRAPGASPPSGSGAARTRTEGRDEGTLSRWPGSFCRWRRQPRPSPKPVSPRWPRPRASASSTCTAASAARTSSSRRRAPARRSSTTTATGTWTSSSSTGPASGTTRARAFRTRCSGTRAADASGR